MMARRALIAAVLAAMVLAACGSDVDVAPRAERQLQDQLDQVIAAVAAADRLDARAALRELERAVAELAASGLVSEGRAAEILSAAEGVAAQLSLLPAPEPSPSPTLSPSPEPIEEPEEEKPDKPGKPEDPGNGNAYGQDEDHGNED